MITVPTTFIIGAGASKPWGLPTAKELIAQARALDVEAPVVRPLVEAFKLEQRELSTFLDDLREDPTSSIDVFLETHSDGRTREIGRAVIAALLGQQIMSNATTRPSRDLDWIAEIVEAMRAGARTIEDFVGKNHVKFITFNFDPVLEAELARGIRAIFKPSDTVLDEALKAIPITHVHGQFPPIRSISAGWLQQAENRVRVVHDEIDVEIIQATSVAVNWAQVLCFLGFSYHPENLKQIDMKRRLAELGTNPGYVFGSALGMSKSDRGRVGAYFGGRIQLGHDHQDSCGTLREYYVLRDDSL